MKHISAIAVGLLLLPAIAAQAQSTCNNRDFEDGNFNNWAGGRGTNTLMTTTPTWSPGLSSYSTNTLPNDTSRHSIITAWFYDPNCYDPATGQIDTLMTSLAPNGGTVSVRLGNSNIGAECERLLYTYTVTQTNYLYTYQFACVMEDPNHMPVEQPFFQVNVYDSNNQPLTSLCDTFYSAQPNVPFISNHSTAPNPYVRYRRWTPQTIDFSAYIGQTFTIEFFNSDCALTGHYGYTYLDASCFGTLIGNVWPGDCDYDLQANNVDLLTLGITMGATGTTRASASTSWTAQPSTDWTQNVPLGANYKHSDTDGDGDVDLSDTLAITLNYSQNHPMHQSHSSATVPVPANMPQMLLVPSQSVVGLNTYVDVDIYVGNSTMPVGIAGLAFTLSYDQTLVQPNMSSSSFAGSWLGVRNVNMLAMTKDFYVNGLNEVAMVRTDHMTVQGYGYIGRFRIATAGWMTTLSQLEIGLQEVKAIDANGVNIPLETQGCSIIIDPNAPQGVAEPAGTVHFGIQPNPAGSIFQINTETVAERIRLMDATGRIVMDINPQNTLTTIDASNYPEGFYFVEVRTATGRATKRMMITR